jgi:hypothetical protein
LHWLDGAGTQIGNNIADEFAASNFGNRMTAEGAQEMQRVGEWMDRQGNVLGGKITDGLADAIRGNKDTVADAMDDVKWALAHPLKGAKALARIEGALTSDELAAGLSSKEWWVRETAKQTEAALIAEWESLTGRAYNQGEDVGNALPDGIVDAYVPPTLPGPYIGAPHGPGSPEAIAHINREYGNDGRRPRRKPRGWQAVPSGARAAGGPVTAGETYLVGERGPEMVTFGRSGHVTPNHAMGGQPIVVNVDGRELFRIMDQRMGKRLAMSSSGAYVRG